MPPRARHLDRTRVHMIEADLARAIPRRHGRRPRQGTPPRQAAETESEQEAHLAVLISTGEHSTREAAELFGVGRSTVYRAVERARTCAGSAVRTVTTTPEEDPR